MIGLDVFEKFGVTALDFLFGRPSQFYQRRSREPSRYMDPIPFAVINFLLWHAALVGTVQVMKPVWNWDHVTGVRWPSRAPEAPALVGVAGAGTLFMLLLVVGWFALAARVVRRRVSLKELIVSVSYALSVNLLGIAYLGLMAFVGFVVAAISPSEAESVGRWLYVVGQCGSFLAFVYLVASTSAISGIRFRRFVVGVVLVPLVVLVGVFGIAMLMMVVRIFL